MAQDRAHLLVQEIERGWYDRSAVWEGKPEQVLDLGDAIVHMQPGMAFVRSFRFPSVRIDERLDRLIEQISHVAHPCLWVTGPTTQPPNLAERLIARGFTIARELQGLILGDLAAWSANNPHVSVKPLSWANVQDYAALCSVPNNGVVAVRNEQLAYARQYLQFSKREIHIFVAQLEGHPVGYALLRLEANGTANLCEAFTLPQARGQGVYLSLVAHRLAWAKERGSTLAVTRANTRTSAPILLKRGFKPVCHFFVLASPPASPQ